jgi:hypothetical protein
LPVGKEQISVKKIYFRSKRIPFKQLLERLLFSVKDSSTTAESSRPDLSIRYGLLDNGVKSTAGNGCREIASEKNTEKRCSEIDFSFKLSFLQFN